MSHPISPMLRLFRDGAASYQPEIDGLASSRAIRRFRWKTFSE